MNNETPTPRTDNHARAYQTAGMPAAYTVILSLSRQLERELNEARSWVRAAMESAAIASATIARLESERDQLRKVADEQNDVIARDAYYMALADKQINKAEHAYNSLPHVVAKGKTK